ncbi:MAG TPA: restriction endonuclease [Gemmataceae bacterium]|nr:restriction endonuclease [Gemmataceae bacterium]
MGEPRSLFDATALAQENRFQFQWWALSLVDACPARADQKKGKDKGIDGRLYFFDEAKTDKAKQIIFSVKSGAVKPADVRDLRGVIERERAAVGVFITLEDPTLEMEKEAAQAAFYVSPFNSKKTPRLQVITVADLLAGQRPQLPPNGQTVALPVAPKAKRPKPKQGEFFPADESVE